jgi:hypothetical protein
MRYLFSQDSGTQIEFITERWFHFSGQKHGQGTRDPDVPLCPPAAQLPPPPAPIHQWRSAAASSHCCSTCAMLRSTATLCRRPAAATVAAPALCFLFHGHAAPQPSLRTSPYFKSSRLHMVIAAARLPPHRLCLNRSVSFAAAAAHRSR